LDEDLAGELEKTKVAVSAQELATMTDSGSEQMLEVASVQSMAAR
jgi:hypothetical protein